MRSEKIFLLHHLAPLFKHKIGFFLKKGGNAWPNVFPFSWNVSFHFSGRKDGGGVRLLFPDFTIDKFFKNYSIPPTKRLCTARKINWFFSSILHHCLDGGGSVVRRVLDVRPPPPVKFKILPKLVLCFWKGNSILFGEVLQVFLLEKMFNKLFGNFTTILFTLLKNGCNVAGNVWVSEMLNIQIIGEAVLTVQFQFKCIFQ